MTSVQADIRDLPFTDSAFDAVCIMRVLHQISDWHRALKESVRVTRLGGRVIVEAIPADPIGAESVWSEMWRRGYELAGLPLPVYGPGLDALTEFVAAHPAVRLVTVERISFAGSATLTQGLSHVGWKIRRRGAIFEQEDALRHWTSQRFGELSRRYPLTRQVLLVVIERVAE